MIAGTLARSCRALPLAIVALSGACDDPGPLAEAQTADAASQAPMTVSVKVGTQSTGRLETFLSTTVQPDAATVNFFQHHPHGLTLLQDRAPQRIHIQPHSPAIPLQAPGAWDFASVDSLVQPILPLGDRSHQYHALVPDFMLSCDGSGCTLPTSSFGDYTSYLQDLVRYYNAGGFTAGGTHYQSPSPVHLPYWAIYDEPNINGFTGTRYAQLYNTAVPAMKAVDPALKLVALEMDDYDGTDFRPFLKSFAQDVNLATAPVDAIGIHYYASCNQRDTDQDLLWETPVLVSHLRGFRATLQGTALQGSPFWLTESNINADFNAGDGTSNCNPGQPFVVDRRGSSAFFASWRPYTFSQVVQSSAGVKGFFQFEYPSDAQYGEVNVTTGGALLGYWVDLWLDHYLGYRLDSGKGASILSSQNSDAAEVEVLAVRRESDASVVVMIANHALRSEGDNNGPGAPRTVVVDLTSFPRFHSATLLIIDKNTNLASGPSPVVQVPATRMTVTLGGYGVGFLSLK